MKWKKCRVCRDKFEVELPKQLVCGPTCALALNEIHRQKEYNKETKRLRTEFDSKDAAKQKDLTKTVFNKMRVLEEKKWFRDRDLEPTCISCNKPNMDFCCGHFKTVASQGNLRYDRVNTYLQCNKYCNSSKSGNIEGCKNTRGYKKGLLERFGADEGGWIIDYCEIHTEVKKWDCDELIEMRKGFAKIVRELENEAS
ncbi:MAG: recombination protein NinG [Colwellia sp.]|nr:recombination protein NinG [Colwellia sp.]